MFKLPLSLLNNEELLSTSQRLEKSIFEPLHTDALLSKLKPQLGQSNNNLMIALGKNPSNELTALLAQLDEKRDSAFIGFRDIVKAHINSPDPGKREAARALTELIERIGWSLYSEGYSNQSAQLSTLFKELDKSSNQEKLIALDAVSWIEELKAAEAEFTSCYQKRVESEISKRLPLLKETKQQLIRQLRGMHAYISLQAELEGGEYVKAEKSFEEICSDTIAAARSRLTRKENVESENS